MTDHMTQINMINRRIGAGLLLTALTACSAQEPPPQITFDPPVFEEAVETPHPEWPVEIVTLPEPLPLPGQLKPLPGWEASAEDMDEDADYDRLLPEEAVTQANASALVDPDADGFLNAMQVYPYAAGALYQLFTAPEQVSDIALQPGEQIISVSAGDTIRWVIGDTVSGAGALARPHVLVKPTAEGLTTNLIILTDRRSYHLEMISTKATYMASVSWHYPQDALLALTRQNQVAVAADAQRIDGGIQIDALRFRYEITGDTPPWRPVRVFDDTFKVYIAFPARLDQGEAPPLFVLGAEGNAELVNYRVRGNYYIVDRLFAAAELRLGSDPQQIVRITRTDGTVPGWRPDGLQR